MREDGELFSPPRWPCAPAGLPCAACCVKPVTSQASGTGEAEKRRRGFPPLLSTKSMGIHCLEKRLSSQGTATALDLEGCGHSHTLPAPGAESCPELTLPRTALPKHKDDNMCDSHRLRLRVSPPVAWVKSGWLTGCMLEKCTGNHGTLGNYRQPEGSWVDMNVGFQFLSPSF